jgi:hypothetical protein
VARKEYTAEVRRLDVIRKERATRARRGDVEESLTSASTVPARCVLLSVCGFTSPININGRDGDAGVGRTIKERSDVDIEL